MSNRCPACEQGDLLPLAGSEGYPADSAEVPGVDPKAYLTAVFCPACNAVFRDNQEPPPDPCNHCDPEDDCVECVAPTFEEPEHTPESLLQTWDDLLAMLRQERDLCLADCRKSGCPIGSVSVGCFDGELRRFLKGGGR